MTLNKKIASAIAAGSVLLQLAMPAFGATEILITGNGPDSKNEAKLELEQQTTVVQTNNADVYNEIYADAKTGGNEAEKNNAGDVSINTGDASVTTNVTNTLNSNVAEVECCGAGDIDVEISNNGADTDNKVDLKVNEDAEYTTLV